MKILVLGSGGREHALVWKLRQSPSVKQIWCAPGNGGISAEAECLQIDLTDVHATADLAQMLKTDLTVAGPEAPLVLGVADEFARRGLALVGPSRTAAQIEGSKVFAKEFMERHGIPTARTYGIFDQPDTARIAVRALKGPLVLKADGLCAGKGVLVTSKLADAETFIQCAMEKMEFGEGGKRLLIEEALQGPELSYIAMTDGDHIAPLAPTRDHKRAFDQDQGPNTGGMGAFSTDGMLPPTLEDEVLSAIIRPAIHGLAADGHKFSGFLYCGLMLTPSGPKVLEFNCRLGDPETQPLMMRADFDLAEAFQALCEGQLNRVKPSWTPGASTCVVMASGGYPGTFEVGKEIRGLDRAALVPNARVFHAGTRRTRGDYYTSSGRVLGVAASAVNLERATDAAYQAISEIHFDGAHYRRDIARKTLGTFAAAGDQRA